MDKADFLTTFPSNSNKINDHSEPIQEAIYDFGGANVKSCASIALSKSISKGLVPQGTKLHQWTFIPSKQQHIVASPNDTLYNIQDITSNIRGHYYKA